MDINALLNQDLDGDIAENWSQRAFRRAAAALALRLADMPSQTVALWFDDAARFACALFAAWQAGKTVLLPPDMTADNLAWIKEHAALLISDNAHLPADLHFTAADESAGAAPQFAISPQAQLLIKTSASSGSAKIIAKTCAQLCRESQALAARLPGGWRHLTALSSVSQQHLYGLSFRIFAALACDWQISRAQIPYPETLISRSRGGCLWISSPALLNHMGEARDWAALRGHLRGIISAGGALPDATRRLFKQHSGIDILDIYGSSETGVIALRHTAADWELFPAVQAGLNEEGCLWAESPWTEGREQSADLAALDGRRLQLFGRNDRIVKFADKRLSLLHIEHLLLRHDWVADAHCALYGDYPRIAAWIALNAAGIAALREHGVAAVQQALKTVLRREYERYALPRYWRFARSLPRDAQAKIRAEDFRRALAAPNRAPRWESIEKNAVHAHFQGRVPLDLPVFSGHFAAFPLVAGAVELQWVADLAQTLGWDCLPAAHIDQLKFQQFVRPDDLIDLQLDYEPEKRRLHFKLTQDGHVCASGRWTARS